MRENEGGAAIHMSILAVLLAIAVALPAMCADVQLDAGASPVTVEAQGRWLVSFSILNRGGSAAEDVEVSAASMNGARLVTVLPLRVGEIPAGRTQTANVRFSNAGGSRGRSIMNVTGTYLEGEIRRPFSLHYTLAPSSSSGATASSASSAVKTPVSPDSNETRDPNEPPSFAAANPGPAHAVPTGPARPMPTGKETSTAPPSDSARTKIYANVPVDHPAGSNLVPVQVNGLWGYANSQTPAQTVIRPQFTHAMPFSEGLAAVAAAGKWGYIDPAGAFRIRAQFDDAAPFAGGIAKVTVEKRIRYINSTGAFVPAPPR